WCSCGVAHWSGDRCSLSCMELQPCAGCRRHVRSTEVARPLFGVLVRQLVLHGGRLSRAAAFVAGAAACYTSTPAPQPPGDHDAVPAPQPPGDHDAVPASEREREVTPGENTTFTPPPDRDELATPPPDPEAVARTAKVFGTVIDARGNRLAHVSVHIHSKGKVIDTRTNERGDYEV